MAWTSVGSTPAFGTQRSPSGIGLEDTFIRNRIETLPFIASPSSRSLVNWYMLKDGIIGVPVPETEPAGELTFTGGSTRPSAGLLYPRGDS